MKLKAIDTLHITAVQPDNIMPGDEFEIEAAAGKSLVDRGLAVEAKAEAPPANKMAAAPANKSAKAK